jgi:hypothetical protein
MTTATQRIPVLVTAEEKAVIAGLARDANLSMGEFLRRAAASFRPDTDNERLLEGLIDQVTKTTAEASRAIDDALAFVEASNRRIAAMEAQQQAPR